MRFTDRLPTTVMIGGAEYPINTDFRATICFELLVESETDEVRLLQGMLDAYYDDGIPENAGEAIERAMWFYRGGEPEAENQPSGSKTRTYSFECDWDYIYTAFLEQYRIDLQEIEYLHWWKFRAMFLSISDKSKFAEIMGYRSVKINNKIPKEQRDFYKKMKKRYAIPLSNEEKGKKSALEEALERGESIEDIL